MLYKNVHARGLLDEELDPPPGPCTTGTEGAGRPAGRLRGLGLAASGRAMMTGGWREPVPSGLPMPRMLSMLAEELFLVGGPSRVRQGGWRTAEVEAEVEAEAEPEAEPPAPAPTAVPEPGGPGGDMLPPGCPAASAAPRAMALASWLSLSWRRTFSRGTR